MSDRLVKVATARNEAEAGFLQGILENEGIPSIVQRSAGADVPEFLAAGSRDVLVAAESAEAARDLLLQDGAGTGDATDGEETD